ncbi:MAG TPA: BREX-3 system P-loop-containing protein BrxF [Paludibacter sp.]|nr:BREX-3 system P-loop-containing protein BrxF [Paludibacter sp.]
MELFVEKILNKIQDASQLYYQLIFLVGSSGSGKTQVLLAVHERTGVPVINVNLELSKVMLELSERQRMLQLPKLLSDILGQAKSEVILLDNIEILFDASFKQDPLRLLQGLSRNKTIVASYSGMIDGEYLVYAEPDHPEYKRYPTRDLLIECTTAH